MLPQKENIANIISLVKDSNMATNQERTVRKDDCEEKHKAVNEKFCDLKANIYTSKESLSNRLDEVDVALLGDRKSPGGLLRDIIDIKEELEEYKEDTTKELGYYKENIINQINYLKWMAWIAMGLAVLAMGGKFFGISLEQIKKHFKPDSITKKQTEVKEDVVPKEIQEYIKQQIQESK